MSRVAITGGLGFIGSHLAERFVSLGWEVAIIDDLSGNVVPIDFLPEASVIVGDAGMWAETMHSISKNTPDLVVHCAAPVGPGLVSERGGRIAKAIIGTTYSLAWVCREQGIPLVNISSSEVYGIPNLGRPGTELQPVGHAGAFTPRSEYGLAKATADALLANTIGLLHCSIRPFNTAGPRQDSSKGFVLPTFVEQAKAHQLLTVYEPNAVRSFTHVQDVCRFITDYWPRTIEEGGAWNVGSGDNVTTIGELAAKVCSLHISRTGNDANWVEVDPHERWGDEYAYFGEANGSKFPRPEKALALGWKPIYTLDDVVKAAYG